MTETSRSRLSNRSLFSYALMEMPLQMAATPMALFIAPFYSRDLGLFPLETAVWKMTGLTARNFHLHGRGTLAVGQHADVVVFDLATVSDLAAKVEKDEMRIDVAEQGITPLFDGKVLERI